MAHGVWERESHFLRRAQAVSAQEGRCAELLLPGRPWKWGSQQDLGTRGWLSRAHGCNTLQTGVRACRRVPGGAALQEADDLLNGGLLVLVGPPVGTEAGGSERWEEGTAGWGARVPPPPSSLDAVEAEHGLHVLGQGLRFWPLEAINDGHDVLATAQSSHNLLEKGGRRKRSGSPKVHLDFSLTLCGRIKNIWSLSSVLGTELL